MTAKSIRDQLTTVLASLAGCAGSRDLDLSVLLSQLGGVDPPPPLQQGAQLPAGGPAAAPPANLHMWQHPQHGLQQGQQQELQQQRPWCEECGRSYSTVGNLKQHVANVHGRGEWVACGVCAKTFKTRQYLQSHLLQQHGIRQRPAPLLPPCPQPLDPSHHMLPHESPSSSAQTSPFSPAYRPYHNQPSLCPTLPQSSGLAIYNNNNNNPAHPALEITHIQHNGHAPQYGQASSSFHNAMPNALNPPPGPAPPQPDSSGQAASPPPPPPAPPALPANQAQSVKQERFSFHTTQIKQEVSNDNYYTI